MNGNKFDTTPLADISACLIFLSRLPLRVDGLDHGRRLAASAWAFPVIGALLGGIGGVVYVLALWSGLTPLLGGALAVAALTLATGALHEDGLADLVDGFGGGRDREAKLTIMRDSRLGTFGAAALALALIARVGAIAALADGALAIAVLVATGAASRAGIVSVMAVMPPARKNGLGVGAGQPTSMVAMTAAALAVVIALIILPFGAAFWALVAVGVGCAFTGWLAKRQIGGQTGDVLGAAQQAAEIAALLVLAAMMGA